jgi:cell division protein FtsN
MANTDVESGLELVLDNRKLIIAFALLIAICGCFFVVGFIEGKRQGYQEGNQIAAETAPRPAPEAVQPASDKPAKDEAKPAAPEAADQPLDWYKNVNSKEEQPAVFTTPPAQKEPVAVAKKTIQEPPAARIERPKPAVNSDVVMYSVQVGAFKQKHEMEVRAKILKEKGFECRMESSAGPDQLYLLKVGKFKTRAEASAVQLRLKRAGITSFIKTN